ncbi:hypothetical protein LTR91_024980 [Friedmanniomyces endolithicus]|uniref:Uncharacterized protein n=1 Tax=Friedmanniomyces endolithicus TaxID=329885 RepID=A0AAN6JZW3_9PEZI|nr:hypothetical protein LTR94_009298 [Friedmanniomyces endolithicus]KAK0797058.1 hypothetical protein LTR59_006903 [Friedmanniomyces endolithicus]KAK0798016.1 hypothetical protein LTR38_008010 [Friedmanniomyces endolithicus]KAK0813684.1 hypothetical protein LTR75_004497 [Friedmanniomyces endolithicus]KAK0850095.1 hypothetical protein LTR03_004809 [Friedmanniomyces endolithicus]
MQPYGQQAAVPQPQQQWQSGNPSTAQQQQGSTTTQTTTTTTQTRLIAQQAQHAYAMTAQPMQWPYAATPQQVQFNNLQAQSAYQYPAQQQAMPIQPVPPAPVVQQADYSHLMKDPPKEAPVNNQQSTSLTTTTGTQTLQYADQGVGGQARQAADANGQGQQFETQVQTMIAAMGICPSRYRWYSTAGGYLCGGGNHKIGHDEIDKWAKNQRYRPRVALVNTWNDPDLPVDPYGGPISLTLVHPPQVDFWQPMHTQHRNTVTYALRAGFAAPALEDRPDNSCKCMDGVPSMGHEEQEMAKNNERRARMNGYTAGNFGYGFGHNF